MSERDVENVGDLGLKGEELDIRNDVFRSAAFDQGEESGRLRQLDLDARWINANGSSDRAGPTGSGPVAGPLAVLVDKTITSC